MSCEYYSNGITKTNELRGCVKVFYFNHETILHMQLPKVNFVEGSEITSTDNIMLPANRSVNKPVAEIDLQRNVWTWAITMINVTERMRNWFPWKPIFSSKQTCTDMALSIASLLKYSKMKLDQFVGENHYKSNHIDSFTYIPGELRDKVSKQAWRCMM